MSALMPTKAQLVFEADRGCALSRRPMSPARVAIVLLWLVATAEGGLADGRAVVEACADWCTHIGESGAVVLADACLCDGRGAP
jgi:hypothetical protein